MIYLGTLISAASGRLNGSVFSRNRGGPYIRAWVQPDETPTTERQAVWDAMAAIAARWPTLTAEQRHGWASYSTTHHRPNRIGVHRPVGAFPEFTRANFHPQQANALLFTGLAWRDDAPDDSTPTPVSPVAFGIPDPSPTLDLEVSIPAGQGYSTDGQAGLNVYVSEPVSGNRHSWPGPFTLVACLTAPGSTGTTLVTLPTGGTAGQALFIRSRYFDQTGRITAEQRTRVLFH